MVFDEISFEFVLDAFIPLVDDAVVEQVEKLELIGVEIDLIIDAVLYFHLDLPPYLISPHQIGLDLIV